jgi:hypothetical protein
LALVRDWWVISTPACPAFCYENSLLARGG